MPQQSLFNLFYLVSAILVILIIALYFLLKSDEKQALTPPDNPNISDPDEDYDTTNVPNANVAASTPPSVSKLKRFGIKKVIRNYFANGSCIAVMNDGRLIRTKAKYC